MKKLVGSMVLALSMSSFALAGGDIAPVEPAVVAPVPEVVDDSGFYLGVAYGAVKSEDYYTDSVNEGYDEQLDTDFDSIMGQAGYKFNQYIALEGRYWWSTGNGDSTYGDDPNGFGNYRFGDTDINDYDFEAWGIYVKPMYPVTDELDVYALLGYAGTKIESDNFSGTPDVLDLDDNGFSWGVGASYSLTDDFSVFVDYVSLYNDKIPYNADETGTDDVEVYTINVGLTYKF